MTLQLNKLDNFGGREGPVLLIVMDGVGLTRPHAGNAVAHANTPVLDELFDSDLMMPLKAHGTGVGLPTDGDMGNSEVGHNALGAGRVIDQGASLINRAIKSGKIYESAAWKTVEERGLSGKTVHFLGLVSNGNVHSNVLHLYDMLKRVQAAGIKRVRIHALLDGRDVHPRSGIEFVKQLEERLAVANSKGFDYRIASGGGRQVITMDRYNANLAMVKEGYECHACGIGEQFDSAREAIQAYYEVNPTGTDQDIPAFVIAEEGDPIGVMQDGDAVVLFNYRGDRAMEISRALDQEEFDEFDRLGCPRPDVFFCSLIEYDADQRIPEHYLVSPPEIDRTMVEYLCAEKQPMFAISETQKFGHVTYFWNGNRTGFICEELESYDEVKSALVPFNEQPEMKAIEITDQAIYRLKQPNMRFGRLNFANGDMVGHTGDFEATKTAMEVVDQCVGKLIEETKKLGGVVIVTADHGNAEEMFIAAHGRKQMKTSHTLNPVPFVIVDAGYNGEYQLRKDLANPGLVNIASTVFNLLGFDKPDDYAESLIQFDVTAEAT